MTTPNLQLPEPPDFASPIAAEERDGQRALDALGPGWIAVLSATTTAPPADAPQGARYLVPLGATGAWGSHARHIAYMTPIGWGYRAPRVGWVALVLDEGDAGRIYAYRGTDWERMTGDALDIAQIDATQVPFDGYGLPLDPATVDDALDYLYAVAMDHEARIVVLEAGGGGGSGGNMTPDTHPSAPDAFDDEFEAGSLNPKWVLANSPSSVVLSGGQFLSSNNTFFYINHQANFTGTGTANDLASGLATYTTSVGRGFVYMEIEYDGTNLIFRASETGYEGTFFDLGVIAKSTYITNAPDRVGIYSDRSTTGSQAAVCDWIRRLA